MFLSLINSLPGTIAQGLIWGIMAIGVFITFRVMKSSDLTVDSSFVTGAATMAVVIRSGGNVYLALLYALLSGGFAGFITSILYTKCSIPAILSGILVQLALFSVNLRIMGGRANLSLNVDKYNFQLSQRFVNELSFRNPIIFLLIFAILIIFCLYYFFGTEKGCAIRATGSNETMAKAQGINTERSIIIAFVISNALVGLSGAFFAQYQGACDINMGRGAIVIGLASVVIGEMFFSKISTHFLWKLTYVILGSIIYFIVIQITIILGLNTNDMKLISALIVASFLSFTELKIKMKKALQKRGSNA